MRYGMHNSRGSKVLAAVHYEIGVSQLLLYIRIWIWPSTKLIGMVWIGNIRPA